MSYTKAKQAFINNSLRMQFHQIIQLFNSALKETKSVQEGSHLSVPRVLKDSIPGTTFGLWNMTVIFIAIAPPLPEERSGRKKRKKDYQPPAVLLVLSFKGDSSDEKYKRKTH